MDEPDGRGPIAVASGARAPGAARAFTGPARVLSVLRLVRHNRTLARLLCAFLVMTLVEYGEWITILVYAYKQGAPRRPASSLSRSSSRRSSSRR